MLVCPVVLGEVLWCKDREGGIFHRRHCSCSLQRLTGPISLQRNLYLVLAIHTYIHLQNSCLTVSVMEIYCGINQDLKINKYKRCVLILYKSYWSTPDRALHCNLTTLCKIKVHILLSLLGTEEWVSKQRNKKTRIKQVTVENLKTDLNSRSWNSPGFRLKLPTNLWNWCDLRLKNISNGYQL